MTTHFMLLKRHSSMEFAVLFQLHYKCLQHCIASVASQLYYGGGDFFHPFAFILATPVVIPCFPQCLTFSHWETRWLDNQINLLHWLLCLFHKHQTIHLTTFVGRECDGNFPSSKLDTTAGVLFPGSTEDRKYHISTLFDLFNLLVTLHYFYKSPFCSCNKDYGESNR